MRGALRSVRPLFAPLLSRLQFRMQSAVEQSSLVPRLHAVEADSQIIKAKTLAIEAGVQLGHAEVQVIKTRLSEIESKLGQSQTQLAVMESLLKELGVRLLNSDQQRSRQIEIQTAEIMGGLDITKQFQSQTAELSARLDVLQVSCDVLRLNQIESGRLDRQGVA